MMTRLFPETLKISDVTYEARVEVLMLDDLSISLLMIKLSNKIARQVRMPNMVVKNVGFFGFRK